MPERNAIHAYVSVEVIDAWRFFAEENGISITGLLEALGQDIAEELRQADAIDIRQDWVKRARKVDAQRRRRQRD